MSLLEKWPCYWWTIGRVRSPVLWCDVIALLADARVGVRTFAPHNSDLSSPWRDRLWYSQTAHKIRIAFQRRESNR
jgi:hypothetical protein